MRISRAFKIAIKLSEIPAWRIAQRAGVNPAILSKIISGAIGVRQGDARVLKIAKVLELHPDECFTDESTIFTGSPQTEMENKPEIIKTIEQNERAV